ncbi:hypothetical protein GCM10025734_00750 [Kitasatospora paranensis]|uniref:P1 family peptidase n=1 Tax=Kitasatospora paranensis TaxID=258053 RepID=UPI0031ED5CC9
MSHAPHLRTPSGKERARALGIPFAGEPGPYNAITDVPGVAVGYATLIKGEAVRTGVTAILPRGREGVGSPCAAGFYSLNGNGELTGTHWIEETGSLALPVGITDTHGVGLVHRGLIDWIGANYPALAEKWLLPVVGETWSGYLNDINGPHIQPLHAAHALDAAARGPIEEGSVGGGTGMNCYQYKGGSGTASRVVAYGPHQYTVGAFVQANFGVRTELTIAGVHLGDALRDDNPMSSVRAADAPLPGGSGSVIVVVATDAPLLPAQCKAMARRVSIGLGRTGTSGGTSPGTSSSPSPQPTRARCAATSRTAPRSRRVRHPPLHTLGPDRPLLRRHRPSRRGGRAQLPHRQ